MLLEHEVFYMVNFAKKSKNTDGESWGMSPCLKGDSWTLSAQTQAMDGETDVVFESIPVCRRGGPSTHLPIP